MNPQPSAMFFDMDGTILDWQSGMEVTWLESCEKHCDGSYVPEQMHEAIRTRRTWFWDDPERARTGRMDLDAACRDIVRRAFADRGLASVDLADRIADYYRAVRTEAIAPYPGAIATLEAMRALGVRMALLTNGEATNQRRSVNRYGLDRYFDCIVIEGEFGVGKPDERVFRHALEALSSKPETTWMIGDSLEADIAPAVSLGMYAVWVNDESFDPEEDGSVRPHRTVRAIEEIVADIAG